MRTSRTWFLSRGQLAGSAIVLVLLWPALALAQSEAPTALERLSDGILDVLIPIFVAFIGGLATWLLKKLKEKTGIEISDAAQESWSKLARKAALRGGEYARKKAKELTDGKKVPGPEILEMAANWAIDMGDSLKLPQIGRAKLEGLIEAHLFELRREDDELDGREAPI